MRTNGSSARPVLDTQGPDQRGPARVLQGLEVGSVQPINFGEAGAVRGPLVKELP